ncbi:MAG: hypothetical protein K2Y21_07105 [Phycisphaerales bacterium]|nr:hypothetical protein [Phycisphaerales bacterium]
MNNGVQPTPDPNESRLDAVESERPALGSLGAMQRDRAALRSAMSSEMARPLSAAHASAIHTAREAAIREAMELDRAALAALSDGVALATEPGVRRVLPSRPGTLATIGPWLLSRKTLAAAASVAIVAGVFYLATMTPSRNAPLIAGKSVREAGVPSWAVLPDRPPIASKPRTIDEAKPVEPPVVEAAIRETRDPAVALAWLREGRLALRLTTDAPRRDTERLEAMLASMQPAAQGKRGARGAWSLARADGREAAVPTKPWPIDSRMADQDGGGSTTSRETSRVGGYDLAVRPTLDSITDVRDGLERATRGRVIFEKVDALAADGVVLEISEPTAGQVLWWTRPMDQWARRVRLPLVVEFGEPQK